MNSADLLDGFGGATLALSAAVVLAFLLSRALRPRFGAGVAYAVWWLVPAALFAVLLPAPVAETPTVVTSTPMPAAMVPTVMTPIVPFDPTPWLAALWLLGALAMAAFLWRAQRRFERGLGQLRPLRDGLWQAQTSLGLPALLGVMRARIVLPDDFRQRYDARERHLMLAHERTHRRRGDHLANFAVAALRSLFWFNPLVHLAARSFRHDQELACDQAVIAAHPDSRRAYGEAMLKTLMADRQAPLGCHWGFSHPLKERVMQLKSPMPRPWARRIGAITVALLSLGTGFAVWSAQPARTAPSIAANSAAAATATRATDARAVDGFHMVLDIKTDEQPPSRIEAGGLFSSPLDIKYRDGRGNEIFIGGHVRRHGADHFDVALVLQRNGKEISKPRLILARDKPGAVRVDKTGADGRFEGVELSMHVDDRDGLPPHILRALNDASARTAPPATPAPPTPAAAPAPAALPSTPTPAAAVAPVAMPALPAPAAAPAPVAAPAAVSPRAPRAPVVAPAPAAAPSPPEAMAAPTPAPAVATQHAAQARRAQARSDAEQQASREATREATRDAAQAATAAEAELLARASAMTPDERRAKLVAIRESIAVRREQLRAAAAARSQPAPEAVPTPAEPVPTAR